MATLAFREGHHYEVVESGCWEWLLSVNPDGYGHCSRTSYGSLRAHRASAIMHGMDVDGVNVNHKCHNRKCINPDHLYCGTQMENVRDCVNAGRFKSNKGEDNPRAILDWNKVREIRARYPAGGVSCADLARQYGVGWSTMDRLLRNISWKESL